VCEVLDVTRNNLWTLLYRARALLRRCIERSWFVPDEGDS
jgi:DNA-directed RNA polymerase specialized sigma24 family protein